jgi:hypothetical protein
MAAGALGASGIVVTIKTDTSLWRRHKNLTEIAAMGQY